ncbi:transposase [Bacillus weihaiensis]|uniref:transposase n=1 Tax=Bacillus weihaiensis TaxID=1547283 RepID=UPI0009FA7161
MERVFGQIKHNQQFRRFSMRGLKKNTIEWGLLCVAHNCKKMQKTIKERKKKRKLETYKGKESLFFYWLCYILMLIFYHNNGIPIFKRFPVVKQMFP